MKKSLFKVVIALSLVFGFSLVGLPQQADAHCNYFPGNVHKCMS